jgi:hypothetical protein
MPRIDTEEKEEESFVTVAAVNSDENNNSTEDNQSHVESDASTTSLIPGSENVVSLNVAEFLES